MPSGEHPSLVSVPLVDPTVTRTVGLIHRVGRRLPPAAQQLYDQIRNMYEVPQAAPAAAAASALAPKSRRVTTTGARRPPRALVA